ncbi:MAG: hypothetical protein AAB631_00670, partial [Patescibacteria group bacterium]
NFSEDVLSEGCQMSVPKTREKHGKIKHFCFGELEQNLFCVAVFKMLSPVIMRTLDKSMSIGEY